jgi:SAM-dependent methyltransferase
VSRANPDQEAFWTRNAQTWVQRQSELDALFAPVLEELLDRAMLRPGQSVLDIGCGTGISSRKAAAAVGPDGQVLGLDISAPMLERARAKFPDVGTLRFVVADAAEYDFGADRYDHLISRFGVMFFADPVQAFSNILKGLKPGAHLTCAAWSDLPDNPWFLAPLKAAKARIGAPPSLDPNTPGPLAFRDIARVTLMLENAGFDDVRGEAVALTLTPTGSPSLVAEQAASIGPAARTMEHFEGTRADFDAIVRDVERAFAPYETAHGVRVPASINFFQARVPHG